MTLPWNEVQALSNLLAQSEVAEEEWEKKEASKLPHRCEGPKETEEERIEKEKISSELEAMKHDQRTRPEYEFIYKQSVSAEDIYFQMSDKDPSSLCCDDMVMRISLPGTEAMNDLKLDLKPTYMKLHSPTYCLGVFLPHTIDPKCSTAEWDYSTMTLHIVMRIVRGGE